LIEGVWVEAEVRGEEMQAPEQTSSSSSGGPPLRDSQDSDAEAMASGGASVRTITCVVVGDGTFTSFIYQPNTIFYYL
jgi:hypothetical protein